MTPEQAMNWLILEGWVCKMGALTPGLLFFHRPASDDDVRVPMYNGGPVYWSYTRVNRKGLDSLESAPEGTLEKHAVEVVDLIISGKV